MPFYLVTQTTLVEAEDDTMAAQKAVDQVRAADLIKVVVKIDDTMTTHVIEPIAHADARTNGDNHKLEDEPAPTVVEPATPSLLRRLSTWLTS